MTNMITHMMDYQTTEHWCNAVRAEGEVAPYMSLVQAHVNILQYAQAQDVWFTPDYDPHTGDIIDNERLEQFRLACLYDVMSDMIDVGTNLDDDPSDSNEFYRLLTQHAGTGEPSNLLWLTTPRPYSLTMRTLRLKGQ
jgi:hypothetical protein